MVEDVARLMARYALCAWQKQLGYSVIIITERISLTGSVGCRRKREQLQLLPVRDLRIQS